MFVRRNWWRIRNRPALDFDEAARNAEPSRRVTLGLLVFCIAFCALVFQKGLKEAQADGRCNLNIGTNCSTMASSP